MPNLFVHKLMIDDCRPVTIFAAIIAAAEPIDFCSISHRAIRRFAPFLLQNCVSY